jgi:acyl-ACP thioesterase
MLTLWERTSCSSRAIRARSSAAATRAFASRGGLATVAAGRRWSLTGDRGGRIEVDSVWIHLDAEQRPARITRFDAYALAAGGRRASARPQLPDPPTDGPRSPWPLRASDVDLHGT